MRESDFNTGYSLLLGDVLESGRKWYDLKSKTLCLVYASFIYMCG